MLNSLDIEGRPSDTRVVVAMSGGVDFVGDGALSADAGYDVVGITLQLYDHGAATHRRGACCAGRDIRDARTVAERIGIPHYVLDYESRFKEAVIDRFADSYVAGETPVPCLECNQVIKFRDLLETARDLGAKALVTGHVTPASAGAAGMAVARFIGRAKRSATRATFCSRSRLPSSPSCRSRWAIAPRRKPASLPGTTACRSPTSTTARTSASCPAGIMPI